MELFEEIDISEAQAEAIARGMFAVARADGQVHEREAALVADFYADASGGRAADMVRLEREADITPEAVAAALSTAPVRKLFVKSCILLAYADGDYGGAEATKIGQYATALSLDAAAVEQLTEQVKDYLMDSLSHIQNVEALTDVRRSL